MESRAGARLVCMLNVTGPPRPITVVMRPSALSALAGSCGADILESMTRNLARILDEAEQLSVAEREELADRLVESLVRDVPAEMQRAHVVEVRRRIAEVEAGQVSLVSGDEAMRRVRELVESARAGS